MVDEDEIHKMANRVYVEVRKRAVEQLRDNFASFSDKDTAWSDLIRVTQDRDSVVRMSAAGMLGPAFFDVADKDNAWSDLHRLTQDEDGFVRMSAAGMLGPAFSDVTDKDNAWSNLIRLTQDKDRFVRRSAACVLGSAFSDVTDKNAAWSDLHRLTQDKDILVRKNAVDALGSVFSDVPDKYTAWSDLHRLTQDKDIFVRRSAACVLGSVFSDITDKNTAWSDLHRLTQDKDIFVRRNAVDVLGSVFSDVPDKNTAWSDLHRLTKDGHRFVRSSAVSALGPVFSDVPDKDAAWSDLIRLTKDEDIYVRENAAEALDSCFSDVPDKNTAWSDLIRLTKDGHRFVRSSAASALGSVFSDVPDKDAAWSDLIQLTQNKDSYVRRIASRLLGSVFSDVPDKNTAWSDLHQLTQDKNSDVRMYAYHSLGSASVYKATTTEDEAKFREELKKAIDYFEQSSNEREYRYYDNPARFCLPFYRSYYAVISEKQEAEAEATKYLDEAKKATGKSESKEALLKAVENLANALKETQKPDFNEEQEHLRACKQYCDHTAELADSTRVKSPVAAAAVMRGIPIVGRKVKEIIAEIQERAEALCKQTKDTPLEILGKEVNNVGQNLLNVKDPIVLEKQVQNMLMLLSSICASMSEEERGDACIFLKRAIDEPYMEDQLGSINIVLSKIPPQLRKVSIMNLNIEKIDNVGQIGNGTVNMNLSDNPKKESGQQSEPRKSNNPKKSPKTRQSERSETSLSPKLESEIVDIFKSRNQKERKEGVSEVNAKTLEHLKHKLHDLKASESNILWLDIGCGDGRCLEILEDIQDRGNICYHGIDISHEFLDDAQMRAKNYGIKSKIETMNTATMKFDSEFDLVSAILFLHEVDPLCLPYVIRNMLRALKSDGTLVISDFEGPYEQEEGVVSWGAKYLEKFLLNIGGVRMSIGFVPSEDFPKDRGFYRCHVKKPEVDENGFQKFIEGYGGFMTEKKEDSRKMREELRGQIKKKVCEILERPDIDANNLSGDEKALLGESMGEEYEVKVENIRLLTNEILFLDEKIGGFERGERCGSI